MKNSKPILCAAMVIIIFAIAMLSGCKKDSGASCSDGVKNQDETAIDCGGSCTACPTCSDGIKNQGETGVDCGGPCAAPCPCPNGYEGVNCATLVRNKFLGSYTGTENCNSGSDNYVLGISASSLNIAQVVITNLHNQGSNVTANVNSTTFDIPLQLIGSGISVIGSGSLAGNNLSFNYTITTNGSGNSCVFTGTK